MSERPDQNQPIETGIRNDPLAELARIVAGENPIEVTAPQVVADVNQPQPALGMEAEAQVEFSADIAPEALLGDIPAQSPYVQADEAPFATDDFDLEASLENQLMQELDVAGAIEAAVPELQVEQVFEAPVVSHPFVGEPSAPLKLVDADIPGLQEVETLADEFVSETTANAAPAPYDKYDVTQEFASEVVPSHLVQAESVGVASDDTAFDPFGNGDTSEAVAPSDDNIPADLGVDFDAAFEQIAQQVAAEDDTPPTMASADDGLDLEEEFESAFASELDQNDILPEASTPFVASPVGAQTMPGQWNEIETGDAQQEFAAAFPATDSGNNGDAVSPAHLSDPSMFDDSTPVDQLGVAKKSAPRRSGFKMAALALGIALLGGFAAVGYGFFSNNSGDGDPIVVMADPGDVKVKPEDRGGVVIANQDKASYAELSGNTDETDQARLLSGTEIASEPPRVSALEPKLEARLTPGVNEPAIEAPAIAPRRVRTFTVKPDGTILAPEPDPVVTSAPSSEPLQTRSIVASQPLETTLIQPDGDAAVNEPVVVAPRQVEIVKIEPPVAVETAPLVVAEPQEVIIVSEPETPTAVVDITPEPIDGATAANGDIAVPVQSPLPKPVRVSAPAPTRVTTSRSANDPKFSSGNDAPVQLANAPSSPIVQTSSSSSPWAIQISSQRSRAAADASYQNLLRRFPNLLNGKSVNIREAQVSGKGTFFRVRIQADSKQAASKFCTQFKSSGGSCFITR